MTNESAVAAEPATERSGWADVSFAAAIVLIGSFIFIQAVIAKIVIPPLAVFVVAFAVAAVFTRRKARAGAIAVGVLALLAILGNLPPIIEDVSHPESTATFVVTGVALLGALVAVVAAFAAVRRVTSGARPVGVAFAVLGVTVLAVGVLAGMGVETAQLASGDVELRAKNVEWEPERVTVDAGEASFFVDNEDLTRHTFTVADLGIDEELPAGKAIRVEIADAEPGSYDITCEVFGHEDMTAVLVVE